VFKICLNLSDVDIDILYLNKLERIS